MSKNNGLVALYVRISSADEDREQKGESNSVGNQKLLLHQYLDKHKDLAHNPRFEAVDDGYSGTNDNRPMLQKILAMAEMGELSTIIVKDNSRFFRNYFESAKHLDINFPLWNVRFISVLDNYDSDDYKGVTADFHQAMGNIVNSYYPKMISQSTITAQTNLMKQGKFIGSQAPYGYKKHPTERHKLAIDEEVVDVVRKIFVMAINGSTLTEIAITLNDAKVETPWQYFKRKFPDNKRFSATSQDTLWGLTTLHRIIARYTYTGAMVSRQRKSTYVGSRKTIPCEPIIVEGMHEAIVCIEDFHLAQAILHKSATKSKPKTRIFPLKSLVRCGNCRRMAQRGIRKNTPSTYYCNKNSIISQSSCPTEVIITEDKLEKLVLEAIQERCAVATPEIAIEPYLSSDKAMDGTLSKEIKQIQIKIKNIQYQKRRDYEQYTENLLSREEFLELKLIKDESIAQLENEILEKEKQRTSILPSKSKAEHDDLPLSSVAETLTVELAQKYIKAVYIFESGRIDIDFLI